jgi:hypothetical protein
MWTALVQLTILVACYCYNVQEDIGVNHGIMSLWFMFLDSPVYLLAFLAPSACLWWLIRSRLGLSIAVATIQLLLAFLIIDLHRWRYPSSISEGTLSVFWSTF